MENPYLDYIRNLCFDEVCNCITEEERAFLRTVITLDPEALAIWQQTKAFVTPERLAEAEESMRALGPEKIIEAARQEAALKQERGQIGGEILSKIFQG